jgi:hypothetical protein
VLHFVIAWLEKNIAGMKLGRVDEFDQAKGGCEADD